VGNAGRGLDAGQTTPFAYLDRHAPRKDTDPVGGGAIRNAAIPDGRGWLAHVSAAALWKPLPQLQVGIEVTADQHPIKSTAQWPASTLIGLIYTVSKFLDLDVGYQHGLNRSALDNQYLFGATFRW
jgi:hypothetical protein